MAERHSMIFSSGTSLSNLESCNANVVVIDCNIKGLDSKVCFESENRMTL